MIRLASLKIFKWCETVAGVIPRIETISPQLICLPREMASKMRKRVSSPSALEILSICERSIDRFPEPARSVANCAFARYWIGCVGLKKVKSAVTKYFDSHLNVETWKVGKFTPGERAFEGLSQREAK